MGEREGDLKGAPLLESRPTSGIAITSFVCLSIGDQARGCKLTARHYAIPTMLCRVILSAAKNLWPSWRRACGQRFFAALRMTCHRQFLIAYHSNECISHFLSHHTYIVMIKVLHLCLHVVFDVCICYTSVIIQNTFVANYAREG